MKAAQFAYEKASALPNAEKVLSQGQVKLMAGSQSLGPMLNLRLSRPSNILDISELSDLREVSEQDGMLRIGACITHAEIEDGVFEPLRGHPWQRIAADIAYRSVRNRGTLGGSLAHADPAADWVLAATAIGAELELSSASGSRRVPMDRFMLGAYTTVLTETELLTAIHIPTVPSTARWGYFKFCRKVGEFAETSCAAYIDPDRKISRIVLGALHGAPRQLNPLAERIAQEGWCEQTRTAVSHAVKQALPERDSIDQKMFTTAVERCLNRAFGVKELS